MLSKNLIKQLASLGLCLLVGVKMLVAQSSVLGAISIKLHNGGDLEGELLQMYGQDSLRILLGGTQELTLPLSAIKKDKIKRAKSTNPIPYVAPSQWRNLRMLAYINDNGVAPAIDFWWGWRLKPRWYAGPVAGIHSYRSSQESNIISCGVESKYQIKSTGSTPIFIGGAGYGLTLPADEEGLISSSGGMNWSVGVGWAFDKGDTKWTLSARYHEQRASYTTRLGENENYRKYNFRRIAIGLAFGF